MSEEQINKENDLKDTKDNDPEVEYDAIRSFVKGGKIL